VRCDKSDLKETELGRNLQQIYSSNTKYKKMRHTNKRTEVYGKSRAMKS
jgi:hypothetical protein